jgi:TPR repeat protein
MKNLVICVILAVTSTVVLANSGMNAFNRKDYNEAYRIWSRSPDTAESQYGLGLLHYEGLGGPKNTERGLSLLRGSSEKGYKPATEYLANVFEKTGDARSALRFLERLQAQERTLKTQERIVDAQKKLVKGRPTISADYCSAVNELIKLGGTPESEVPELCALGGLASPVSPENARQWLSRNFQKKPSVEALEILVQDSLDPKKSSFNPVLIEDAIWILDPDLTNRTIKTLLTDKGKVNQDICRSLPFREADQRSRFSAYCALVVISGQNKNPIISAREYISGTQGRVGISLWDRIPKGLKLLGLEQEIFDSLDGVYLRLEASRSLGNWKSAFEIMQKNVKLLSQSNSPLNERELRYVLDRANLSSRNVDKDITQTNASELAQLVDAFPDQVELKKYACAVLAPYTRSDFTSEQDPERITLKALSQSLDNLCAAAGLKRPDSAANPPPPMLSVTATSAARSDLPPSQDSRVAKVENVQRNVSEPANFDKALFDCNQGNHSACGPAAQAILSNKPPAMYQSLTKEQREEVAERLLLNAAKAEDPASLALLWDIYEFSIDSSKRSIAQKYLTTLLAKGHPSGLLRQQIQILPRDPIGGILGQVGQRKRYVTACESIKKFIDDNQLNSYDRRVANRAYNGPMCKSLR